MQKRSCVWENQTSESISGYQTFVTFVTFASFSQKPRDNLKIVVYDCIFHAAIAGWRCGERSRTRALPQESDEEKKE